MLRIQNNAFNSFNWSSIGSVNTYAKNLVNSYLEKNSVSSAKSLGNFFNNAVDTTKATVTNNAKFTAQNTLNLKRLQTAAGNLSTAAKALGNGRSNLVSSNDSVVKANATYYSNRNLSFKVGVQSLASGQQSASQALNSLDKSAFAAGKNSLNIATEKGNYAVSFDVKEGDTNLDALNSLAKSINASGAGLTAEVVNDKGQSTLKVTSKEIGAQSGFEISGNAAATLGMQVQQQASDARYTVDGKSYTSDSNTVSIPGGRGATMTLTGTGNADLTRGTDASALVKAAQNFASAYNSTVSLLTSGAADGAGAEKALSLVADNRMTELSMGRYGGYAAARLSAMGLSVDQDGMMQVDAEKLTNAVKENPTLVRSTLSGYGSVTDATQTNVSKALRIPAATYTNFSNMNVQSSLIDMMMPKAGTLFDFYL